MIFDRSGLVLLLILGVYNIGYSQVVIRDAEFTTSSNSFTYVDGDVEYIGSKKIYHSGLLEIKGNWYNSSITDGIVFDTRDASIENVAGEANGIIVMSRDSVQEFYGYLPTEFPNLRIEGGDRKRLMNDIKVRETLDLTNLEFDVNGYNLTVLSDAQSSVKNANGIGYVNTSNNEKGWFGRKVVAGTEYLFPLGNSKNSDFKYRPITLTANKGDIIQLQFQNYNADVDDFDVRQIGSEDILGVCDLYHHKIKSNNNIDNDIIIEAYPYNSSSDGDYNAILWNTDRTMWYKSKTIGPFNSHFNTTNFELQADNIKLLRDKVTAFTLGNLRIIDSINIQLPNAFTPNGDGINDYLTFSGLFEYEANELVVFNRWGSNVFQAKNYNNNWQGAELNEGTYFYVLRVKAKDGKWHEFKNYLMIKK